MTTPPSRSRRSSVGIVCSLPEFLRLQSHFLFAKHFCRVRRGNEKGHVETHVGYARRNLLVPVPSFASFAALNEYLAAACYADLYRRVRGKAETKAVLLDRHRGHARTAHRTLRGAPGGAGPGELALARAIRPKRLFGADRLRPSRRDVSRGDRQVRVLCGPDVVATHSRSWGKEGVFLDFRHYLALLERKPGAFDFARPLEGICCPNAS